MSLTYSTNIVKCQTRCHLCENESHDVCM